MRTPILTLAALALVAGPVLAQVPETPPQGDKPAPGADALQWTKAPPGLPEGAELAVIKGDPMQPGPYTIRLRLPDGYRVAPHTHPTDESITVVSGALLVSHGQNMRATGPSTLEAGGKISLAAGTPHSVTSRGITIVEIESTGPFEITYVNSADDPRRQAS